MAALATALASHASACTVSEDMMDSLPLNSKNIPNRDRLIISEMVIAARQWPDVKIRGIVYAGGYIKEHNPKALANQRAELLKKYLIQLGIEESNIWINERIIKNPDLNDKGGEALNQIAVTLVPICENGCDRLCDDPRVTPTSKAIK
jgi:hypothetical protein